MAHESTRQPSFVIILLVWSCGKMTGVQTAAEFTLFSHAQVTWNEALVQCQQVGMTLATLDRQASAYVKTLIDYGWLGNVVTGDIWIGLYDSDIADTTVSMTGYSWADGCQPMTSLTQDGWQGGWMKGEPDATDSRFCVLADKVTGEWKSELCREQRPFMCQKLLDGCKYETVDQTACYRSSSQGVAQYANSNLNKCMEHCNATATCWFIHFQQDTCTMYFYAGPLVCPEAAIGGDSSGKYVRLCHSVTFINVTLESTSESDVPNVTCLPSGSESATGVPVTSTPTFDTTTTAAAATASQYTAAPELDTTTDQSTDTSLGITTDTITSAVLDIPTDLSFSTGHGTNTDLSSSASLDITTDHTTASDLDITTDRRSTGYGTTTDLSSPASLDITTDRTSVSDLDITTDRRSVVTSESEANTTLSLCRCDCRHVDTLPGNSIDISKALKVAEEIQRELLVERTTLSKQRRRKESASDDRPSSKTMGAFGALFVISAFVAICLSDAIRFAV